MEQDTGEQGLADAGMGGEDTEKKFAGEVPVNRFYGDYKERRADKGDGLIWID